MSRFQFESWILQLFTIVLLLTVGLKVESAEIVRVAPTSDYPELRQPQAAVGNDGTIYVTYAFREQIYCSVSSDGGKNFSTPVGVGRIRRLRLRYRKGPRIATSDNSVVITAMGRAADILAWRSTDKGKTWQEPTKVTDAPDAAKQGYHAMKSSADGKIYCAWLDQRDRPYGHNRIFGSMSADGGKTWSKNQLIYESPDKYVCPCCQPAIAFDSRRAIYVMWRNNLDGCRDFYVAVSQDGGQTIGKSLKQGTGSWKLKVCPMDGGDLAIAVSGKIVSIWQRKKQIFRVDSTSDQEVMLAAGILPSMTNTTKGVFYTWVTQRNGAMWLVSPAESKPTKLTSRANDPMIAAYPSGKGPVVAVWEQGRRGQVALMAAVVANID